MVDVSDLTFCSCQACSCVWSFLYLIVTTKAQQFKDSFSTEQSHLGLMAVGITLYSLPSAWLHSGNHKTPGPSTASTALMSLTRSSCVPHSLRNSPPSKESILTIRTRNLFTSVMSSVVNSLLSQWMITMTCQIRASHGVMEGAFALVSEDCPSWLCHILSMLP